MLEIININAYYRVNGRDISAIKDCRISIEQNESFGIIGESGSGKTTLAHALMGIGPAMVTGTIILDGENITLMEENDRRCIRGIRIAMSFPNSVKSFHPLKPVCYQVAEILTEHGKATKYDAIERVHGLLSKFGLKFEKHKALPNNLSGGERQKVLIAMALVGDPEVVILDEPTMGLDPLEIREMVSLLAETLENRISLVISHDVGVVKELCSRIGVLYSGEFLEIGNTNDVLLDPNHPYTRALLSTVPGHTAFRDLIQIRGETPRLTERPDGCPFFSRCTQAVDLCAKEKPTLKNVAGRRIACLRGGIVNVLESKGLSHVYSIKGGKPFHAVQEADITLRSGDFLVLVGETGSGKTTLARMLSGLLPIHEGRININGDKTESRVETLHRKVQMIFQDPRSSVSHRFSVEQIVREPLDIQKIGDFRERDARVKKALKDVGLLPKPSLLEAFPHQLSEGEIQRLVIARALVQNPEILIADEPTSMLDPGLSTRIMKLFVKIQRIKGLTVMMVTHDIVLARHVASHLMVMLQGRIIEAGLAREVLIEPWHPYTRNLLGLENNQRISIEQGEQLKDSCGFQAHCPEKKEICSKIFPLLHGAKKHWVRCHKYLSNSSSAVE